MLRDRLWTMVWVGLGALAAACGDSDAGALPAMQAGTGAPTAGAAGVVANGAAGSMQTGTTAPQGNAAGAPSSGAAGSTPAGAAGSAVAGTGAQSGAAGASVMPPSAAGASGGAAGSTAGSAGAAPTEPGCSDTCPFTAGVQWSCRKRFMYGLNYAWHTFAADFGGNKAWSQPGVSGEPAVEADLTAMADGGAQVLRWWLWPDFRGDGVTFDASDTPMGLGGTALADVERALELAEKHDLYLMLTLFSFDNFRATRMESQLKVRGIKPIVVDSAKRRALLDNVVAPLARAVAQSAHSKRMLAWDMINEPEWAITGPSQYGGDPAFDPQTDLEAISHAQMETFLRETLETLRANSKAQITVGATAVKWKSAWSKLDLDFHQFHMYDWINMYWPYDKTPMSYGLDDKPVVMGEFPLTGLSGVSYGKLIESWFGNKYAGALAWAFTDPMFSGNRNLMDVKQFAGAHACETRY